jgi:hypothetical protein
MPTSAEEVRQGGKHPDLKRLSRNNTAEEHDQDLLAAENNLPLKKSRLPLIQAKTATSMMAAHQGKENKRKKDDDDDEYIEDSDESKEHAVNMIAGT